MPIQHIIDTAGILLAGFSILAALVLIICYFFFIHSLNKTPALTVSCVILLAAFCCMQYMHLQHYLYDADPMNSRFYLFWLFIGPPAFFIFFRTLLRPDDKFNPLLLLNLAPLVLSFFVRKEISIPILFVTGAAYSAILMVLVNGLREQRKQYEVEMFFLVIFCLMAIGILILGLCLPYIDNKYFYYFYTLAIGSAFLLIVGALIIFEDLPGEIAEIAKVKYSATTLRGVDVDAKLQQLDQLMQEKKLYQDENINLAGLATEADLSSHQLSELINTRKNMSFSQYMRSTRVEAAKKLLVAEPNSSVLSISLETGFKSQSSFYAAFKDITGKSPGAFRTK